MRNNLDMRVSIKQCRHCSCWSWAAAYRCEYCQEPFTPPTKTWESDLPDNDTRHRPTKKNDNAQT